MSTFEKFFSTENNLKIIEECINKTSSLSFPNKRDISRLNHLMTLLNDIKNKPDLWDEHTQQNIQWVGSSLTDAIVKFSEEKSVECLNEVFVFASRFLGELELSTGVENFELNSINNFLVEDIEFIDEHNKRQLLYALYRMPISILKEMLKSEGMTNIKKFNEYAATRLGRIESWDADLINRENRINNLKDTLNKYETAFNFVGLYDAFKNIADEKIIEKNSLKSGLIGMSVLIILPLVIQAGIIATKFEIIVSSQDYLFLFLLLPTAAIEIILIYYFRILLYNYKSVKTQILQLDLRKTLCQFIQNYVDYSEEVKEKSPETLEKFEKLIFSGLSIDEENLPTTFDGMDQFIKFFKEIKN